MRRLVLLAETDSTNTWLSSEPGLRAFTSVRALLQRAGYGRAGRLWFTGAPDENLAFSILLPYEPRQAGLLPAHAALVVNEVLGRCAATRIRWPNDIFFDGLKLAGILCQGYPAQQDQFVAGIGVNVAARAFPRGLIATATSLAQISPGAPEACSLWLMLTRAFWREFRHPRSAQQVVSGFNRVAVRYNRRREYPGEVLQFETLLGDGRAVFSMRGQRLVLDQAG